MTRVLRDSADVDALAVWLKGQPLPVTVSWVAGAKRSNPQNRLQRRWVQEIANWYGDRTAEEVRAMCKLHFGVPIRRRDDAAYRATYDARVKPLPYDAKLALMAAPLDLPVTRDMTTAQKTEYLTTMGDYWRAQGVRLTEPDLQGWEGDQ
jgi:hypothetical protein